MMFLAVSQNAGDPSPYLAAENARMQELQRTGVVEQMLLKADWSGAVLLLRAADHAAAREAVGGRGVGGHQACTSIWPIM